MIYQQEIAIVPGYTQQNHYRVDFRLPFGVITQVKVGFTPESAAALHVAVYHLEFKLWPLTPNVFFSWAGEVFQFEESYFLSNNMNDFSLRGWNDSTLQPHTATFWFTVLPLPDRLQREIDKVTTPIPVEMVDL